MSSEIARLGAQVASEQDRLLAEQTLPSSDDLLGGIRRRRRRARNRARAVTIAAVSMTVAIAVSVSVGAVFRTPQTLAAPPTPPSLGVRRAETASVPLSFEDGTKIEVLRGATAAVEEVRAHGAVIALHEGTLKVEVVHTPTSQWDLVAGPFGIHVTGTRFEATWDSAEKRLTVAMTEGTVDVSGPCVKESLSAPNQKAFTCNDATMPVAPASAHAPPRASSAALPARPVPVDTRSTETAASLLSLADKARLAGDAARARTLYATVRERFPGTDEAGKSAFLLGRIADSNGAADEAVRWFEVAAHERGGFGAEALGRWMELEQKRGNSEGAQKLAAEYLKTYPLGAHRAYATSILEARR